MGRLDVWIVSAELLRKRMHLRILFPIGNVRVMLILDHYGMFDS